MSLTHILPHSANEEDILHGPHVQIIVKDREGTTHTLQGPLDLNMNLMELMKAYELPVMGTCGGMALCSSCHVYVRSNHTLPSKSDAEEAALDNAYAVDPQFSRLSCQIRLTEALEGLEVELGPE